MRTKYIFFLLSAILNNASFAALPFVTDDSNIQDSGQIAIETFTEAWFIPKRPQKQSTSLYGQYISASYGVSKHFEATIGGMTGYDSHKNSVSYSNLILQIKSKILDVNKLSGIPGIAIDFGYATKSGRGEYYDDAENFYIISAITQYFFNENLVTHVNIGAKASRNIEEPHGNITRPHIGIAFDISPFANKQIKIISESYNGAPNSPRDSSGYFKSYQVGVKYIKSQTLSFHILYGTQPTFASYDEKYSKIYKRTQWIQFGIRKVL